MLDLTQLSDAVRSEGGITRRLWLAYGAALAGLPALGLRAADKPTTPVKFSANPFSLGVASGDPTDSGVVLWTELAPRPLEEHGGMPHENVLVSWVIANDEGLKDVVRSGTTVANPFLGHSVHIEVEGLKPDSWYWYQFRCADATSPVGHTRTMPSATALPDRLRFAFASCQNYEQGLFTAYEHMAKDDLDLVVFLGDYIYEGAGRDKMVRKHVGPKCKSLEEYRLRYAQYRSEPLLRRMHARCPWLVTWDDHEVENNYANDISQKKSVDAADFLKMRAHAYQAYYEMMPLRAASLPNGPHMRLYRTLSFGRLATFQVLDTRQYRTNQPNGDKPSPLNEAALNPKNTLLGAKQAEWLTGSLLRSTATWNVLAQQVMMGMVDHQAGEGQKYSMDQWPGYANERMRLLQFLGERHVPNPVVLTGDIHSSWVNDLRVDDRRMEQPVTATEFVGTSISSAGDGESTKGQEHLFSENPFVKFHNRQRGYVRCNVSRDYWRTEYQVVEVVTKPGYPAVTKGAFVVQAGKPGAIKA